MIKPKNFETTQEYGSYPTMPPGNYPCVVHLVVEGQTKNNRPKLEISMDVASGEYKNFFAEKFRSDTRENKKWPCIVHQLTEDNEGNCSRGLKTFISAVAASNDGFDMNAIWNENFPKYFRNKLVGCSFRLEEYISQTGEYKMALKPFRFFPLDTIADQPEPETKYLVKTAAPSYMSLSDDTPLPWET